MQSHTPPAQESAGTTTSTDPRPTYFSLGIDTRNAHYCYETARDVVHVVRGGRRIHIYDCRDRSIDEFMAAVESTHGWHERDYGLGIHGMIDRAGLGAD